MTSNSAYAELLAHLKQTTALGQVAGLLTWDQETVMPKAAADHGAVDLGLLVAPMESHPGHRRAGMVVVGARPGVR